MKQRNVTVCIVLVGTATILSGGLSGCTTTGTGQVADPQAEPQTEFIVWGDPDPNNTETHWAIRDVNNVSTRFAAISADGDVYFSSNQMCNDCEVTDATILVGGTPRTNIRFGPGIEGGERRPFLVSIDGYYIEMVSEGDAVVFQEEDVPFEEDDDPGDDLAERVNTTTNPTLEP